MRHQANNTIKNFFCSAAVVLATTATAQIGVPGVDTDNVVVAGLGCPHLGAAYLSSMSDMNGNTTLSIELPSLYSDIFNPVSSARTACSIRAKTNIPAGRKLKIVSATAYGEIYVSGTSQSSATIQLSALGSPTATIRRDFKSANHIDDEFVFGRKLAKGEGETVCRAQNQAGLLAMNLATSIQALGRVGAEGAISISRIEITYRLDGCK